MEKLSYGDHVLLGLGGKRASGNITSPKPPHRNSDIDFDDVFGGPPRCLIPEMRRSFKESMDSYSFRRVEETPPPRNPWSCLSEKPVFGEDSPSRRKYPSDDFFDDIFKSEDTINSPRKPDRDIFSSTPPSRILSPTRPLPPSRESFVGGSSLPTDFSLSSKSRKGIDSPTFGTPCLSPISFKDGGSNVFGFLSPPSFGVSRLASQAVPELDDSINDTRPSYRYSRLSHEFTLSRDISSKAGESAIRDTEGCFVEKGHGRSGASNDSSQFHFSIYKWASKGVMLMMPAKGRSRINTKERDKNESIVTGLPAPVLQGANLCSLDETSSTAGSSFRFQQDNQDNGLSNNLNSMRKDNVDGAAVPSEPESNPVYNLDSHDAGESGKENKVHSGMSAGPPDGGSRKGAKKEVGKPELKSLGFLFKCSSDDPGNGVVKLSGGEDGLPRLNNLSAGNVTDSLEVKKLVGREVVSDNARTTSLQDGPVNSDDKMLGNRVKGKVKEYVKIFSQEASQQLSRDVDARRHSSRRKESGACKIDKPVSVKATVSDGQDKINNENCVTSATNTIIAEQVLKQAVKEHIDVGAQKVNDYSLERNDSSEASPGFNGTIDNIDESHCEDIHVTCLVEEVPTDQNVQPLPNKPQEEIQTLDLKIRQWSSGKEGNIRSLLSTLQYILWPESGWKPVPLVDIIEGSSVRKAYQKALLCLHPDKLQQRGAALDQKYIAEKVFDILQEAWTHFNSVCPM